MIDKVEAKIAELKKQQREEYYRKKEADLAQWGLGPQKKGKKSAPLVVTDEEYEALIDASSGVGMPTRNGFARVLNIAALIVAVAGIIIGFVVANLHEEMSFPIFMGAVVAAAMGSVSAQDVQLTLHPSQAVNVIPKEIYGQFAEHLGRCIYGGIWVGKDSKIDNIEGYRKDVFEALKDLEVPVMRWPGGCFADEYHWMDGIGPQSQRPRMVNTNWGGTVEDNSFGTHEFLNLCEMLGCEPYISGNVGSGTVEEMAKWVEYMNSDTNSTMAELRRKNGREKPWNVKYFGVGNESWGCGGNMKIEYYVNLYRRYNTYARNYGSNKLFRIASGANGGDTHWMDVAMKECRNNMDGISVHFYAVRDWGTEDDPITGIPMGKKGSALQFTDQQYYEIVSKSLEIEDIIRKH